MPLFNIVVACININGRGCPRITSDNLGCTDTPSRTGLIPERVNAALQLQQFRIVCEVTSGTRDMYTEVSVVAEYRLEGSLESTQAQFEFLCVNDSEWGTLHFLDFTSPSEFQDINTASLRRDCHSCVSPTFFRSSLPGKNHCLGTIFT